MARPPKPQHLKDINGSARHNPGRANHEAPKPRAGIGQAPEHFTEDQVKVWDYLVSTCPAGVLGDSDRPTFEVMSILFWRFRNGSWEKDSPIPQLMGAELGRMDALMGRYGMTPSDRQKIIVPKGEKKNPFGLVDDL